MDAGDERRGERAPYTPSGWLLLVASRPVAVTMIMLSVAVFGWVAFGKLEVDLLPEISYPTLTVRTSWPGAAPEDVEERVSERLQEALSTLPDLVRTSSISRAGASDVLLEFEWGTPMAFAVQDVREKLDGAFLPRGAERPLILRYDPNLDPILKLGMTAPAAPVDEQRASGNLELTRLRWLAENRVKREIETIEGVAAVVVRGGLEEEIRVLVDPATLAAHGLDPEQVSTRLAQENINASGGSLREGPTEYLVRTVNEFQTLEEIEDLALVRRGETSIRVRDIGQVVRGHARREVVTRIGGDETVVLEIYREAGANIVQLAARVKERVFGTEDQQELARERLAEDGGQDAESLGEREELGQMSWRLRREACFALMSDQSTFIQGAVDDVRGSAVVGALLAVLVLWLFLRKLSATLIISTAIPMSVIATFAVMFMQDVTLNVMSLGGLALGVGMLVDDAIVVLESILRCREEGDGLVEAAVRGTQEVAGAVVSATLTTVAVFAPIVFVEGIAGQLFGDQALTVVISVMMSLVVAFLLIPMLAARPLLMGAVGGARQPALKPPSLRSAWALESDGVWPWSGAGVSLLTMSARAALALLRGAARLLGALYLACAWLGGRIFGPILDGWEWLWTRFERGYARLLRAALGVPLAISVAAALLFALALTRLPGLGVELLPDVKQGEFTAHVRLEAATPLEETDRVLAAIEREVRALPHVRGTAAVCGVEAETLTREIEGPHTARLTILVEGEAGGREILARETAVEHAVREVLERHPEIEKPIEIKRPTPFALEAPIAVEVRGHDLEALAAAAEQVAGALRGVEGLGDVRTSLRPGHPELRVTFDRDKALQYGLDLTQVSNRIRDHVLGNVGTRFTEGEERVDVRVIGDEIVLSSLGDVLDLVVNPGAPTPVPLSAVADVREVQGPAEIRRIGNARTVLVSAHSESADIGGVGERIEAALSGLVVPEDVTVELGGQKREIEASIGSMQFALLLALFLVYVTMAVQFESVVQPLIIMLTVPLGTVGVIFALELFEIRISVTVLVGMILLAGVVVDNAIVLLDRVNQNLARGIPLAEAMLEGSATRLRPIMMTTLTTVLGLVPMTGWLDHVPVLGALNSGLGREMREPMAITVIAGLLSATLLTLVVIPSLTHAVEDWRARGRARRKSATAAAAAGGAA